jgi:hypothetical protein
VSPSYDWEPTGTVDEVPVQRRGLAVFVVLLGVAAVALAVTGAYRRIPGAVARAIHGRPPAATAPVTSSPVTSSPAPVAPQPAAPAPAATTSAERPAPASAAAPAERRESAHRERPARPATERASSEHRHRASRGGSGVRYMDHPGSIELSPTGVDRNNNPFLAAPNGAEAPSAPPASAAPPPAQSAPPDSTGSSGFSIEPPAPTTDTPGHDIAPPPPAGDGDQPLPPSVR